METGLDVAGSGSGPGTANKKRNVVTSKVANNNNGRTNSLWGLVQTLADNIISRQTCVHSANDRACPCTTSTSGPVAGNYSRAVKPLPENHGRNWARSK